MHRRRIATDPDKPLHPFSNATVHCETCGKRWLDYLECEAKGCVPVYSPQAAPQPTAKPPRVSGRWATLTNCEG